MIEIEDYDVDYTQYYYKPQNRKFNKNNKKHRKHGKLKFFIILVILAVIVFIVVKIGGINNIRNNVSKIENSIVTSDYTYFFVSSESFTDNSSAVALAKKIKYHGCAGYIDGEDGCFNVLFNIYRSNSDALSVSGKLSAYGYNLTVIKKNIASKKKYFDSPNSMINHNLEMIENLNALINEFYELALNLDSSFFDLASGKSELKTIIGDCESRIEEYKELTEGAESCLGIIGAYNKIIAESRTAYESNIDLSRFSAEVKYLSVLSFYSLDSVING